MTDATSGAESAISPAVSVVMPAHDAERFLVPAVESILGQTLCDLELIVVENGSTDGTAALLERWSGEPRVRVLRSPLADQVAALNAGVEAARSGLVARMDADDVARPDRLRRQVEFLRSHPEVAVVSCAYRRIGEDGTPLSHVRMPTRREGLMRLLRHQCLFASPGAMMRRGAVLAIGGFRPQFPAAQDFDLWLRLMSAGWELENLPDVLIDYREVASGVSRSRSGVQREKSLRAVVGHRLREDGLPSDPAQLDELDRAGLARIVPSSRQGLRLLIEGVDIDLLDMIDAAGLDAIISRVRPLLGQADNDDDLALIAYRIATRSRHLGRRGAALRWYLEAWRLHRPLTEALLRRSFRGGLGR